MLHASSRTFLPAFIGLLSASLVGCASAQQRPSSQAPSADQAIAGASLPTEMPADDARKRPDPPAREKDEANAAATAPATEAPELTDSVPSPPPPFGEEGETEASDALAPSKGKSSDAPGTRLVEATDPFGRWMASCLVDESQVAPADPRSAATVRSVLLNFEQEENQFSSFVGSSANGDAALFRTKTGTLVLHLADKNLNVSLSDELASDSQLAFPSDPLLIALSRDGEAMAYYDAKQSRVLTLGLSDFPFGPSASEQKVAPQSLALPKEALMPGERVGQLSFEGNFLRIDTTRERESASTGHRCRRSDEALNLSNPLVAPKVEHTFLATLSGTKPTTLNDAPGLIHAFGRQWLRRHPDGRISVVRGRQARRLTSSRCGARILAHQPSDDRYLISCEEYRPNPPKKSRKKKKKTRPRFRFDLYSIRRGLVRSLHLEMAKTNRDASTEEHASLIDLRAGREHLLLNLKGPKKSTLPDGSIVLLTSKTNAVIQQGQRLLLWTPGGQSEEVGQVDELEALLLGTESVATRSTLFHLSEAGVLKTRTLSGAPIAIGPSGAWTSPASLGKGGFTGRLRFEALEEPVAPASSTSQ